MKKLIICRGIPASGKSTWTKKLLKENPNKWKRVNRDSIRYMTEYKYWNPDNEPLVSDIMNAAIKSILNRGFNVIVDNTNLSAKYIKNLRKLAENIGDVIVEEKYFDISLPEALRRDKNRERKVGKDVLTKFYKTYINKNLKISKPIYYEPKNIANKKLIQDKTLPNAIMVDIDGTLAIMNGRGPYNWDKVDTDLVNESVADMVREYYNHGTNVLILTARDGIAKNKTKKWLKDNSIPYNKLFIKPENDMRKDKINKLEMFNENIRDKYNILFVMDDRDQVVELWREIGLTCFQVDYGKF